MGSYNRSWLRWLDGKGSTFAVPLAHFCPQASAYLQMVMANTLSGCASAHARWHAWRRGGSAALQLLGLPVRWLAWWGRWMCVLVAAHYADAPDAFVMADNVELPWPSAQGGMEWEWRVVSLKDIFPGELLALCVQDKNMGPEEDLGGWRGGDADTESRAGGDRLGDRPEHGGSQPAGQGGGERRGERPAAGGSAQGSGVPLRPLRPSRGARGPSEEVSARVGRKSSTSMLNPPPPHQQSPLLSGGSASRHTGRWRMSWERGRQQAQQGLWVRLPERQFPAGSDAGRWARERRRCGGWDVWLRNLHACLPRAPPGLLERRLIRFLDWGVEAARDLQQPDFLPLITGALSSLDSGVWESLLHDSTSPKLLMQRIREEVLCRGLGGGGEYTYPG